MEDIPKQLTDASLKAHFKTYGKVVELKVMKTKTKRFGFIKYDQSESVDKALASGVKMTGEESIMLIVQGHKIVCEREIDLDEEVSIS